MAEFIVYLKSGVRMAIDRARSFSWLVIGEMPFCDNKHYSGVSLRNNHFTFRGDEYDLFERVRDGRLYFLRFDLDTPAIKYYLDRQLVKKVVDANTDKQLWPK